MKPCILHTYNLIFKFKFVRSFLTRVENLKLWYISEECGALESVKAASELISPVSGKVIEKNETVENKPSLINTSCYEEGWLFKVELNNLDEVKSLMNEEAYNTFLKSDAH